MYMLAMPGTHPGITRLEKNPTLVHCSRCWTPTGGQRFETVEGEARVVAYKAPRFSLQEYCGQCAYERGLLILAEG